jgi:hypothetical protein
MRKPNFFIVGAPKCGTTAMSEYLRSHPAIFMSIPKEPSYFAEDFPGVQYVKTLDDYQRLFSQAKDCAVIGEASPSYMFSKVAIGRILQYQPDAKFLVMLRRQTEMLPSYHSQLCYSSVEDEQDFQRAWVLQDERREGRSIPPDCREPAFLQYAEMASYSDQLERLRGLVPGENLHIVLFDDLVRDPAAVYRGILAFLGVEDDGRAEFPILNSRKSAKSRFMKRWLHLPPAWAKRFLVKSAGTRLHNALVAIHSVLLRANTVSVERTQLDPAFRDELIRFFEVDVSRLEEMLGRDLSAWRM